MIYYLAIWLETHYDLPGMGLFNFISFRAGMAMLLSLTIAMIFGKKVIRLLQLKQVGETIRDLGLEGQVQKQGTPTMGGLIIIGSVLVPVLLLARIDSIYIWLLLLSTLWLGIIGFIDDYIKVFMKNKAGLAGKFKLLGQIVLGVIVGATLYFNPNVVLQDVKKAPAISQVKSISQADETAPPGSKQVVSYTKSTRTTVPFFKNNELDYAELLRWAGGNYRDYAWLVFIPLVIVVVTAVSNGANITDGLDGLAAGVSTTVILVLGVFAYVSGNIIIAEYLNIMYIPNLGEVVIFTSALMGACIGFLWFNAYPAQVFMGDTGSLTLGGLIAVIALMVRKELLIPVLCGIFLVENLSVMMQVAWFKYTKKKYGEGRRIFKMSPLHHHYQKSNLHEAKIVTRFWIVGIFLAIFSIITLKIR